MKYGDAELHNVVELIDGGSDAVITPEAWEWLGEQGSAAWRVSPEQAERGQWITRVPDKIRRGLNVPAQLNALQATGCERRFNLHGESARVRLESPQRPVVVEVYHGSFFADWQTVGLEPTEIVVAQPPFGDLMARIAGEADGLFDPGLTRVVLPWRPPVRLLGLDGEMSPPRPGQTPQKRYLAYGSSITHGNASVRPTSTYPQRVAYALGADMQNLGFGGGAHLEREIADYIATETKFDIATLELGINLISSIDAEEFRRRVDYFVKTIAGAHPEQWLFCIDLFTCRFDYEEPAKIRDFREVVAEIVGSLGSDRVVHLNGRDLLSSPLLLAADLVHPSPLGMEDIGNRLSAAILKEAQ